MHSQQAETHPRVWTELKVEYLFTGRNIEPKAVEQAINLSKDKYCPAQNMIKVCVEIDLTYSIVEVE